MPEETAATVETAVQPVTPVQTVPEVIIDMPVAPIQPVTSNAPAIVAPRMAKDVTDPVEIAAIIQAKMDGKTYTEIETMFNLKPTNGMTAYRIIKPSKKKA